jgi:hypothetical protein
MPCLPKEYRLLLHLLPLPGMINVQGLAPPSFLQDIIRTQAIKLNLFLPTGKIRKQTIA